MRLRLPLCLLAFFSLWTSLFSPFFAAAQTPSNQSRSVAAGLQFGIREAPQSASVKTVPRAPVKIENLSEADAAAILRRLPPLPAEAEEKTAFSLRADTLKPPRTGSVMPVRFPSNDRQKLPAIKTAGAPNLRIERFSPTGKTPLAVDLSVKFSQPMIAFASQEESATRANVPVKLTPEVKGKWRWLGTDTLIFDAAQRFPMATRFTATIPKGTKSVTGATLAADFSWQFSTPPPTIEKFAPQNEDGEIDPEYAIMAAKFNQEIDERAVLSKILVTANGKPLPIRLVTGEVDESYVVYQRLGGVKPRHWLAFRTIERLPRNADVRVTFEKGLPSAEGAATSEAPQIFTFKTLPPLKFVKSFCGYYENQPTCAPSNDFRIQFNHSLYPARLEPGQVVIEPAIENVRIVSQGTTIFIQGKKKPNTSYKVTVSGAIKDFYKQPLGDALTVNFSVGTEQTQFFALGRDLVTLDPHGKPVFSVYSKNHASFRFRLYAVTPADYPGFRQALREYYRNRSIAPAVNFGRAVADRTVAVSAAPDVLTETRIDLREALPDGVGHAVLVAEPTVKSTRYDYLDNPFVMWIQATQIGIDMAMDYEKMFAYVSDLKSGRPLPNAEVSLRYDKEERLDALTNAAGTAEFALPDTSARVFLVAQNGADSAIFREARDYDESTTEWRRQTPYDARRWFVFDDRKMYRPHEEVSIKGYVRRVLGGKAADIAAAGDAVKNITYVLQDSRFREIARGTVPVTAFGAFDFRLKIPENVNLGYQRLNLWAGEEQSYPEFTHSFRVEEFRRPEFEVTIAAETPAPYLVGTAATFSAAAKYYTGGALAKAAIKWTASAAPARYSPPNHESFTFGTFVPWWREVSETPNTYYFPYGSQNLGGTTDENGAHRVNLDFQAANPARPYNLRLNAETQDVNRQTIADTKNFLIHPAEVYVGLRTPKTFVRQGEPLVVEAVAADLDGKRVAGAPIEMTAVLKDWQPSGSQWTEVVVDTQTCRLVSTENVGACSFTVKQGGRFTVTATVLDARERPNTSETTVWAAGGNTPPKRGVERETVELIPDKKEYAPNETAEILVNAPFFPAEAVMTLERGGILKTERLTLDSRSTVLQIPIEERFLPNLYVKVDLVGATDRTNDAGEIDKTLPPRPAFAAGEIKLGVSTASRKLNVAVAPQEKITAPGAETKISVAVRDHLGNAVPETEIALVAVDEGVLSLTGYKIPDPLAAFYQTVNAGVRHYHSRAGIILANPQDKIPADLVETLPVQERSLSMVQLDGMSSAENQFKVSASGAKTAYREWTKKDVAYIITENEKAPLSVRRNFDALAIFAPSVVTDAAGNATISVKLPDNLTRYRITAVAVTKSKQFGAGESNITARQALQVRPSAPRFMNFGDRAELPVVLQNESDAPLTVDVALRAANARILQGGGRRVTIPANDRAELRFPIAPESSGTARFQIGAVAGELADAAEFAFPVYTPATTETFATYGTTDQSGAIWQTVQPPGDVFPQFGGLEITTSSTQLQELTDAFIYLHYYPFGCTEQVSSRILSVAALRDVLQAFNAKELPTKAQIETQMKIDIERLRELQHTDGGFSFWSPNDTGVPYVSAHVGHALARAKAKGYAVREDVVSRVLFYLKTIETKFPAEYSAESKLAISAYALYVRDLLGDKDAAKAKKLLADNGFETLSAETLGWLLAVLADDQNSSAETAEIKRVLLNRVTETAGAAHFVTSYKDGEYVLLASARRADAVILDALLKAEPENTLIPKIVRGLLAAKTKGRWQNTQENAFVLLALDKYFQVYEKATPDFVTKIWLGESYAGAQKFSGRSVDSNLISVPMQFLQRTPGAKNLVLDRQGAGRLYYRIGMKYAPKNLNLPPADYGFTLSRTYEAVDDPADVKQNPDNSWTIRAGARVRVRVRLIAPTRRYHVALVDHLPAGFEIINSRLATAGVLNASETPEVRRRSNWFQHQNLRDNRAEAFTMLLAEGVWNYSYFARATTPGNFVVPPAKAEEMYMPETFGRSRTSYVKVE